MPRLVIAVVGLVAACSDHAAPAPAPSPSLPSPIATSQAPGFRLPDGVTPLAYDVRLEVDPESDAFTGHVAIRVRLDAPTDRVWIHADELVVTGARWDGGTLAQLPVRGDEMIAFGFGRRVEPAEVTLAFDFTGGTAHDQEGLFRQRFRDHWYLYSQGESTFARRIVPCFDEPRWKTPWRVTLVVPTGPTALANMPASHEQRLADGRREIEFAETPPIPAYLLAIAVGPFDLVDLGTVGRGKLPVRVATFAGERARVAVVGQKLPAIVDALERYLDDALPWPKLDLVVVPHLFGAMENPGLVTFDARLIAGDAHSAELAAEFVHVAAHELAHQWFGNLVTPVWWDDLWLAEAFASWLGERTVDTLGRSADSKIEQAIAREHALELDALPGALALRRHVTSNDDPEASFEAVAYDKGQAVLATFERWAGDDAFRAAARAYLREHRGGSASSADFVRALAAAATPEIAQALDRYVAHAGVPTVELALDCSSASPPPRSHSGPTLVAHARDGLAIPLCMRVDGAAAPICALVGDHTSLPLARCPAWVVPTDGYYVVAWTATRPRDPPLAKLSVAERLTLGVDIDIAVRRNELPAASALAELRALAGPDVAQSMAAVAIAQAIDPLVADADRPAWTRWLAARFAPQLQPAAMFASGNLAGRLADALVALVGTDQLPAATVARAQAALADQLSRKVTPDPDVVAAAGGTRAQFDQIVALARTDSSWSPEPLGKFGPALAPAAVELALGRLPSAAAVAVIVAFLQRADSRTVAWAAVRARLPELLARIASADAVELVDAVGNLCDAGARDEVVAAFGPSIAGIPDGSGHLTRALARIDRCIAGRALAGDFAAALR